MNIPIKELIKDSKYKKDMEVILLQTEESFNTWKTIWTKFISPALKEEVFKKLELLSDIDYIGNGGFPGAHRQRISFSRKSLNISLEKELPPVKGIKIEGNFLFNRAEKIDFINTIKSFGISSSDIGDIWLVGDRGAQLVCTTDAARKLDRKVNFIRDVEVKFEKLEIHELNLPIVRTPKIIKSVEASTRLDAIASAGFGISRSKITTLIKEGKVSINWEKVSQSNRLISTGDQIQLEQKGSLHIKNIDLTKRERWRIEMLRQ